MAETVITKSRIKVELWLSQQEVDLLVALLRDVEKLPLAEYIRMKARGAAE